MSELHIVRPSCGEQAPTADAYRAACEALEKHRRRADELAAEVERLRANNNTAVFHLWWPDHPAWPGEIYVTCDKAMAAGEAIAVDYGPVDPASLVWVTGIAVGLSHSPSKPYHRWTLNAGQNRTGLVIDRCEIAGATR